MNRYIHLITEFFLDMENKLVRRPLPVINSQIGPPTATVFCCVTLDALMFKCTFCYGYTPPAPENRNNNLTYKDF